VHASPANRLSSELPSRCCLPVVQSLLLRCCELINRWDAVLTKACLVVFQHHL